MCIFTHMYRLTRGTAHLGQNNTCTYINSNIKSQAAVSQMCGGTAVLFWLRLTTHNDRGHSILDIWGHTERNEVNIKEVSAEKLSVFDLMENPFFFFLSTNDGKWQ